MKKRWNACLCVKLISTNWKPNSGEHYSYWCLFCITKVPCQHCWHTTDNVYEIMDVWIGILFPPPRSIKIWDHIMKLVIKLQNSLPYKMVIAAILEVFQKIRLSAVIHNCMSFLKYMELLVRPSPNILNAWISKNLNHCLRTSISCLRDLHTAQMQILWWPFTDIKMVWQRLGNPNGDLWLWCHLPSVHVTKQ